MFPGHPGNILSLNATEISDVAPAVRFAIRIDKLAIETGFGNAEAVIVTDHGCRVHDKHDDVAFARSSEERDHTVVGVVQIDPIKSFISIVELPKGWLAFVNVIQ